MPDRERILHKVRTAIGRHSGERPEPPPAPRLEVPRMSSQERVRKLLENFPGGSFLADSADEARAWVESVVAGKSALASPAPVLREIGVQSLAGVLPAPSTEAEIRLAAAEADIGITGADYALADPGALVILSTDSDERLISLLPPVHIAVIKQDAVLTGLDELFTVLPDPAAQSSSMVIIGGPSKTGDIEMTLTLGVHGPRELHLVILG